MSVRAYVCIGGPLDGNFAMTDDFADAPHHWVYPPGSYKPGSARRVDMGPPGIYFHLRDLYFQYNAGGRARSTPSMVWIHKDSLKMPIPPRLR